MKNDKKQSKRLTAIFMTLIAACFILAFMPRSQTIKVIVPASELNYNPNFRVTSVVGDFNGKQVEGYDSVGDIEDPCIEIELPQKIQDQDKMTIVSTTPNIGLNFFWGKKQMHYYGKGQINPYSSMTYVHPNNDYFKELSLVDAIKTYDQKDYALLFSVKGNSKPGFDHEMAKAFESLGFNVKPSDIKEDSSYIAWYYNGQANCISDYSDACETSFQLNGHEINLISGGSYVGNISEISVDGVEYSANRNGINFVVYDPSSDRVVDSLVYNTNATNVTMRRNTSAFYAEYTTTVDSELLQLIALQGHFATVTFQRIYFAAAILFLLLFLDIRNTNKKLEEGKEVSNWYIVWRCLIVIVLLILAAAVAYGYRYLLHNFENVTVDQLIFHMNTNLDGTNWSDYKQTFINLGISIGVALAVGLIGTFACLKLKKKDGKQWSKRMYTTVLLRWLGIAAAIGVMFGIVDDFWNRYHVYDYLVNTHYDATIYKDHYVDPHNVKIQFPEKKKNLIYIYLESMEISSSNEIHGGGKSFNAIPELTEIAFQNDNFTNDHNVLNGAVPLNNCRWTIAGIVAQSTGLPLGINPEMSNRNNAVKNFMPGAIGIGDILEKEGYHNVFLLGSDATFGNRNAFFGEHGNFDILDYYWARNEGKFAKDYHVWWGYEDKKLFEYAKEEASKLGESSQPFNLTLLTVDTHFTDGYRCEDCPNTYEQQYSNVIACSSKKTKEFIDWVHQQPWSDDTVIVLSGDHLCMDSNYFSDMPEGYERKTYVSILNSSKKQPEMKRYFATVDMFPTTISALGASIEGDRLAFGTDLYSGKPTLLEDLGLDYMNNQFGMYSSYYNKEILHNK